MKNNNHTACFIFMRKAACFPLPSLNYSVTLPRGDLVPVFSVFSTYKQMWICFCVCETSFPGFLNGPWGFPGTGALKAAVFPLSRKKNFGISYLGRDRMGQEAYLSLLSDWDPQHGLRHCLQTLPASACRYPGLLRTVSTWCSGALPCDTPISP